MSASINFHIHNDREGVLKVESRLQELDTRPGQRSAYVALHKGADTLNLFFDSIEDMEKVEFHLSTLIMEAREKWSTNNENSK
jgi:hypothetical protein